jgi:hypothetical protein
MPMPAFAPVDNPPLSGEGPMSWAVGFDDLLEPGLPVVAGLAGSTAVSGEGTDEGSKPGGERLVGVAIEGSSEAGEGLVGEGLTGITEGGGATGGASG